MSTIQCAICKEDKSIDDCWCVIDSKTKSRYYECKKKCKPPIPIEITIPSDTIQEEEELPEVHDIPPKGLFERAMEWFTGKPNDGYTKMKVE